MSPERWQRIKATFQAAAELPRGAERASFVARECAGDALLRERVEALLAAHERAGDFIEAPAYESFAESLVENESENVGRRVGAYRLVREIGRGGMGAVYLAERADGAFEQRAAVKLIKRGMDTDFILSRFRHERRVLASLEHPHIARLLDGGTTEDGLPYLVMEYVEGEPVDVYCDARRLDTDARLSLFLKVCAAVSYAHQRLVVHRDIKPSNIIVNDEGEPKLLDFGIAKLLDMDAARDAAPTATALRLMTPEYASPEQVQGLPVTTAADVYSLGVVLYELLTGHRPYRLRSRSPAELARAVEGAQPERPSVVVTRVEEVSSRDGRSERITPERVSETREGRPERLRRRLRGDLDNVVLTALRKEPERRYSSVDQFAEDIRSHLAGRPVSARGDSFGYRASKFVRRNKLAVGAAALVALSLVVGVVTTAWQAHAARVQQARAEAERARAQRRFDDVRRLAHSLIFDLHDQIKDLPGSTQARALLVNRALEYLDSLAQEAGGDAALQRELASAYEKLGDVQGEPFRSNLGDSAGAMESYRKALLIREAVAQAAPSDRDVRRELARGYRNYGFKLWDFNDSTGALDYNRKALELYRALAADGAAGADDRDDLARSYIYVGMILLDRGETAESLEDDRRAQQIYESLLASDPSNAKARAGVSMVNEKIGNVMLVTGDAAGSLEMNRKALALRAALSAADPRDTYYRRILEVSYEKIGDAEAQLGEAAAALASYRQELAICQKLADEDRANAQLRSELSSPHAKIGDMLARLGDARGALEHQRAALALREELAQADPSNLWKRKDLIESYSKTASALARVGERAAALDNCRKAASLLDATRDDPASADPLAFRAATDARLAETYALLASGGRVAAGEREEMRRAACDWYRKSFEVWQDLRARGKLSPRDAAQPEEVSRHLADCEPAAKN